jgi:hypothetical protein
MPTVARVNDDLANLQTERANQRPVARRGGTRFAS